MGCLVDPGTSFDTPGTPGGASIVEWNKFWSFRSLWEGRAFFSPRVRLNCSCQVVGHNRSSSLRYDQDFFVPIFCSHRYFMLTFLSGLSFDVCSYIPTGLHSKVNHVNLKIKCIPSVTFTIVPKLKCFLKSIPQQVIYKPHSCNGVCNGVFILLLRTPLR